MEVFEERKEGKERKKRSAFEEVWLVWPAGLTDRWFNQPGSMHSSSPGWDASSTFSLQERYQRHFLQGYRQARSHAR